MKNSESFQEKLNANPELMRKEEQIRLLAAKHGLSKLEAARRMADLINSKAKQSLSNK